MSTGRLAEEPAAPRVEGMPPRRANIPFGLVLVFPVMSVAPRLLTGTESAWVFFVVAAATLLGVIVARTWQRRSGRRRAAAMRRAGRDPWEGDWLAERTLLRHGLLGIPLPPLALFAAFVVCMLPATAARRSAVWGGWAPVLVTPITFVGLLTWWVVVRGRIQVRLERFPLLLGERATFWIATTEGSARIEGATAHLLCRTPPADGLSFPSREPVPPDCWFWWDERTPDEGQPPGPDEFVAVSFDIPRNFPGTSLATPPRVHWELTVSGRTRWGRIEETFLVPVYARHAAPAAA